MFGKKTKNENVVVVTTKEELKAAIKSKKPNIEVHGDLAKKMKWMSKLNRAAIIALIPALLPLAAVGGVPASFAVPAAATAVGISGGNLVLCALSISIIIAILKGYNIEAKSTKGDVLRLTKNR